MRRLGGSSCNLAETQRPRLAHEGLGKQPLLPNEKDARGSYKKPEELLTALSLRAEALLANLAETQRPRIARKGSAGSGAPPAPQTKNKRSELALMGQAKAIERLT